MKKLIFSLALTLCLCMDLLPTTALAEDSDFDISGGILYSYDGPGGDVVLPTGITSIWSGAFDECNTLTSVVLSSGITSIGTGAFAGCSALTSVTLPNTLTTIGEGAFDSCTSLKNVVIPNSVTTIKAIAFIQCTALTSIVIPDSVTTLGEMAFQDCTALERAVIGNGIPEIAPQTFSECINLKNVTIGTGVTSIGRDAFFGCESLDILTIPENVVYIGDGAFQNCTALSQLNIPNSVTCHEAAFYGCDSLPENLIPGRISWDDQEEINDFLISNGILNGYIGTDSDVVIPSAASSISFAAFRGCTSLEKVTIPASVNAIGDYAFLDCINLKRVVFPDKTKAAAALKYLNVNAVFKGCTALEEIVNCPDEALYNCLNVNEQIKTAWELNPDTAVVIQSEKITDLSNQICVGLNCDYKKTEAIFEWITTNIKYDYEYYGERKDYATIYPEDVLSSKLSVCDGYARLTQSLLQAQGIPTVFVSGTANGMLGDVWESHAWNLALIDGRWIYIDSTWGSTGGSIVPSAEGEARVDSFTWFDPTPLFVALSHKGETSFVDPNAPHYAGTDDTPYPAATVSATPNRSTVLVNGQNVAFDAYTINQNNYFKLRDLAKILSGTGKQFEVTWDGGKNAINLISGKPYTAVGGELAAGDGSDKNANLNTSAIYLDGQPIQLTAYTINGNNYFKLRDIGAALNFGVDWDGANSTIVMDTTKSYTPD